MTARPSQPYALGLACVALALCLSACAAARNPEAGRPRGNEAPYPVVLGASEERRAQSLATWSLLARTAGATNPPAPELRPITATLDALPDALNVPLRLPQVGGDETAEPSEEEQRESLRRFIASAAPLLGVVKTEVSLVERVDLPNGTRRALYRQNPFDLPLRGGYGDIEILYTPDRRIISLRSTAIPDTERLRRALTTARQQQVVLTPDKATPPLAGRLVNFTDAAGRAQSYTITASDQLTARELVVYPVRPETDPNSLELRLAWEVAVGRAGSPLVVYVDAVRGEPLGASAPVASQP
ncbi:MAG TPA: hypothetical protein VGV59_09940 [Pyrinomonadaceae bacterium]|nr:hypothetical protein [Pyrinomonadaceae bacterium]